VVRATARCGVTQTFSNEPPDCGAVFLFGTPMLVTTGRMSMTPSKQGSHKRAIRAALYARISTLNHGQNPEVQLRELREYCQHRRFTITHECVDIHAVCGDMEIPWADFSSSRARPVTTTKLILKWKHYLQSTLNAGPTSPDLLLGGFSAPSLWRCLYMEEIWIQQN
jgi:hypothetical protein